MKIYTDIELQDLLKRSRTSVEICEYLDYLEELRVEINPSIHMLMSTLANGKLNRALETESKMMNGVDGL